MNIRLIFFCILLLQLQACTDFSVSVSGRVIDKETGYPISNAIVNLLDENNIQETNSIGYFEVSTGTRITEKDPSHQSQTLTIQKVTDHVYQHISYLNTDSFGKVACNGMVVFAKNEAIIFDTPLMIILF